jgi:hypothetical protein
MNYQDIQTIFTDKVLSELFPVSRSDEFFDALFGDASEGAYDIKLQVADQQSGSNQLLFDLNLVGRPGKCLACNLTHGLPDVFKRHPILNIQGLVEDIDKLIQDKATCKSWSLGSTKTISSNIHAIPLAIKLS